jgi:serine/threonine-protein kinase
LGNNNVASANPEQVGRYKILERVGRGGMGVLLRGIDPVLDREVAIKLMLVDFSEDAEQMRPRFYREALAAAKLQHPNIVTVFEFAEDGTTPYIVMEFLRGTSLAARMTSPLPLTLDEKLSIIAQLCSALHYAHAQGVVHRDIKPANIFLLPDGSVKLLDFGIAKLATSTMTRQGDVLGSASYMSPEQVSGSPSIDGRSDIFSTGVVLYELLANRKPFNAETLTATVVQILQEDPPSLDTVAPGLPAQLVAAVTRALAKDPARRFANAGELGKELQWIRQALQSSNQGAVALDETRFASPTEVVALHKELEKDRKEPTGASQAVPGAGPVAGSGSAQKWLVPLVGIGTIAAIVAFALMSRGRPASEAPAALSGIAAVPPGGAAEGTSAPAEVALEVTSVPGGATITLNGQPTNLTTPATVRVGGAGPHRLRLARAGFVPQEVDLAESDLRQGSVSYTLAAAEVATVDVTIESAYPVDVFSGAQNISRASASHRLKLPPGAPLRVSAPQYLLNASMKVGARGVEYRAPALGYLTVLTRHETCNVKVGDRVLGFPPISRMQVAAGQYRVEIECPNGPNPPGQFATVVPNETATVRIY